MAQSGLPTYSALTHYEQRLPVMLYCCSRTTFLLCATYMPHSAPNMRHRGRWLFAARSSEGDNADGDTRRARALPERARALPGAVCPMDRRSQSKLETEWGVRDMFYQLESFKKFLFFYN